MKFGILGRNWGRHYARLLTEMDIEFVTANRDNADEVLADSTIDCIIIATPTWTHFDYIKVALLNGKNVLVEKPMVLSIEEAEEIKEFIGDKIFMVAHQYCYNDAIRELIGVPLKEISLEHSGDDYWEIAPHLFSVVDLLNFKGKIDFKFYPSKDKIRKWTFDGKELDKSKTEPLKNELEHFIDRVKNNKTPLTDIEHGTRVIRAMEDYAIQYYATQHAM